MKRSMLTQFRVGVWCTWIRKVAMDSPEKASNTWSMLTDTDSGQKVYVNLSESIS